MDKALQAQDPFVRKMIIEKFNTMNRTSCALTVIERLLRESTDKAEREEQDPSYYTMDGLHYCIRCLADKMAEDVDYLKGQFGID